MIVVELSLIHISKAVSVAIAVREASSVVKEVSEETAAKEDSSAVKAASEETAAREVSNSVKEDLADVYKRQGIHKSKKRKTL